MLGRCRNSVTNDSVVARRTLRSKFFSSCTACTGQSLPTAGAQNPTGHVQHVRKKEQHVSVTNTSARDWNGTPEWSRLPGKLCSPQLPKRIEASLEHKRENYQSDLNIWCVGHTQIKCVSC